MKERYDLEITEADRTKAEREAERYQRKYANRKKSWENRRDWGNWGKAEEDAKKRKEAAEKRRRQRDAAKLRAAEPQEPDEPELDDGAPDEPEKP